MGGVPGSLFFRTRPTVAAYPLPYFRACALHNTTGAPSLSHLHPLSPMIMGGSLHSRGVPSPSCMYGGPAPISRQPPVSPQHALLVVCVYWANTPQRRACPRSFNWFPWFPPWILGYLPSLPMHPHRPLPEHPHYNPFLVVSSLRCVSILSAILSTPLPTEPRYRQV